MEDNEQAGTAAEAGIKSTRKPKSDSRYMALAVYNGDTTGAAVAALSELAQEGKVLILVKDNLKTPAAAMAHHGVNKTTGKLLVVCVRATGEGGLTKPVEPVYSAKWAKR